MTPILEIRRKPFGIGYSTAAYPLTNHRIAKLGFIEARLIVSIESELGFIATISALVMGLVIGGTSNLDSNILS